MRHPHILEFKGVFLTQRCIAFVLEYVEGETIEVSGRADDRGSSAAGAREVSAAVGRIGRRERPHMVEQGGWSETRLVRMPPS